MLGAMVLSFLKLKVVMLGHVMLRVSMLNVIMLSAIVLVVMTLRALIPLTIIWKQTESTNFPLLIYLIFSC
jgi:hypothetical protein